MAVAVRSLNSLMYSNQGVFSFHKGLTRLHVPSKQRLRIDGLGQRSSRLIENPPIALQLKCPRPNEIRAYCVIKDEHATLLA